MQFCCDGYDDLHNFIFPFASSVLIMRSIPTCLKIISQDHAPSCSRLKNIWFVNIMLINIAAKIKLRVRWILIYLRFDNSIRECDKNTRLQPWRYSIRSKLTSTPFILDIKVKPIWIFLHNISILFFVISSTWSTNNTIERHDFLF